MSPLSRLLLLLSAASAMTAVPSGTGYAQHYGVNNRAVDLATVDAAALGDTLRSSVGLFAAGEWVVAGGVGALGGAFRAYLGSSPNRFGVPFAIGMGYARTIAAHDLARALHGAIWHRAGGGFPARRLRATRRWSAPLDSARRLEPRGPVPHVRELVRRGVRGVGDNANLGAGHTILHAVLQLPIGRPEAPERRRPRCRQSYRVRQMGIGNTPSRRGMARWALLCRGRGRAGCDLPPRPLAFRGATGSLRSGVAHVTDPQLRVRSHRTIRSLTTRQ